MKKLLIAATLLAAPHVQAEGEVNALSSAFFNDTCAVLNDNLDDLGDGWEQFADGMLVGWLNGMSLAMFAFDGSSNYVPAEGDTIPVFLQVTYNHCRNNPEKQVARAAIAGLDKIVVRKPQ